MDTRLTRRFDMPDMKKYDRILDALYQLLEERNIQNISVSDIARKAGIEIGRAHV